MLLADFSLLFYLNVRFFSYSAYKKIPPYLSRPKFLLGGATTWDPFVYEGTNLLGDEKCDIFQPCALF